MIGRLLRLIAREDRSDFAIGLALGAVGGFVELAGVAGIYPFLALLSRPELVHANKHLIHIRALTGLTDDRSFLLAFGAACLVIHLLSAAFMMLRQAYLARFALRQIARISTRLLRSYLNHPYPFFLDHNSGELAKNVVAQSDAFANGILLSAMTVFSEMFVIVALTGLIVWVNPAAGIAMAALLGGISGLVLLVIRGKVHKLGQICDEANGRRFTFCLETLQSAKEIKAAGAEDFFWRKFEQPAIVLAEAFSRVSIAQLIPSPLIQSTAFAALMGLALYMVAAGRSSAEIVPLLSVYAAAGYRLMPSLSRLSISLAQMRPHKTTFENVAKVLSEDNRAAVSGPVQRIPLQSELELRGIRFSYAAPRGERPVLDGVGLTLPRGGFVALAGGSGAGKTTLADIILGLLTPQEGQLLVDGRPLPAADMPAWRQSIGYIPQSLFLCDDTIAANIAFGVAPDRIDMERVHEAARLASLDELVPSLPQGYLTPIGERGSRLSGGQRQRLGIARALYRDPDLLILDESTSSLDGITEAEVLSTIKRLRGIKTILIIAHRSTTIRGCESVVLLRAGRVAATGRYEDLIAHDPHFAALMSQPSAAETGG